MVTFKVLLKTIANFPQFNAQQIALIVSYKEIQLNKFLTILKSKNIKSIKAFIQKEFLKTVKLNRKEQTRLNKLLKMIIRKK